MRVSFFPFCIIACYLLFLGCSGVQQVGQSSNENRSLIYRVSGGELVNNSYLVGTVPVQDSAFFQYPDKLWRYLEKSDVFLTFSETQQRRKSPIVEQFDKHYAVTPAGYFKQVASEQVKPVISLSPDVSPRFQSKSSNGESFQPTAFRHSFLIGDIEQLIAERLSIDLAKEDLNKIQTSTNYQLLDELLRHMKLQPVFFPVDVAYLGGNGGLLNLLKARGYDVKPMKTSYYRDNANQLVAQQVLQRGGAASPSSSAQNQTGTVSPYQSFEIPDQPMPLNLPSGIINLTNWGTYSLKDSLLTYQAPNRLKAASEVVDAFSFSNDELTYSIEMKPLQPDVGRLIQQLIIENGGQLTQQQKGAVSGFPSVQAELIYAENKLSKHQIIQHPTYSIIVSVKGNSPSIFSREASEFLESVHVKQALTRPVTPSQSIDPQSGYTQPNTPQQNSNTSSSSWNVVSIEGMQIFLPSQAQSLNETLSNQETINGRVIPRGQVDNNMYLITTTPKQIDDQFKLFNESINAAAESSRAVIVERTVMPDNRTNYASYLLRDAMNHYYRIHYWYVNQTFYQFVIRGDENSVENKTAKRILESVYFN